MIKLYRFSWLLVLLAASSAQAIVTTVDATVTASAQEFSGTVPGNSDLAFENLDETTGLLPLSAEAQLLSPDSAAGAQAIAIFSDPRASALPNPLEFAFNIAASSESDSLIRIASGASTETREINFLADEIGAADGTTLEAESQFFVDGLVLVWGLPEADFSATNAQISLNVRQKDAASAEPVARLTVGLTLSSSGGAPVLEATGGLAAENVIVLDLSDTVPGLGPVHLLIIPNVAIPYTYPAQVGTPFQLNASIQGQVHSQPGTGAFVAMGVPLVEIGAALQALAGPSGGAQLEGALSAVLSNNPTAAKPLPRKAVPTSVRIVDRTDRTILPGLPVCGAMGVEILLFPGLVLLACVMRRPR